MITWNLKLVKKLWCFFFFPPPQCFSVTRLLPVYCPFCAAAVTESRARAWLSSRAALCNTPQNQPSSLAEGKHCNYRNTSHSEIKQNQTKTKKGAAPHSSGQNSLCLPRRPFSAAGRLCSCYNSCCKLTLCSCSNQLRPEQHWTRISHREAWVLAYEFVVFN